jgi:metallo-beta-lactamase family protein
MDVKVKILGAARTVTGSRFLLEIGHYKILIDCGLFQGLKELRLRNWSLFPVEPSSIDAIVLTHAHIDHIGYLPRIYKEGFAGPVYCSTPSAALAPIMLEDAARLQMEEARYAAQKGYSRHEKPRPLYDTNDVAQVLPLIQGIDYDSPFSPFPGIEITFSQAGHIIGAASVKLKISGERLNKTLLFSGDIGAYTDPIHPKPDAPLQADCLFLESTYGDRVLDASHVEDELADTISHTFRNHGCVLIPAFAVGRTQLMLYYLGKLIREYKMRPFPVYIDSPMAMRATQLYKKYLQDSRPDEDVSDWFNFEQLHYCNSQEDSIALNQIKSGAVIISASGMATGGRILHHLYHRLPRESDTVLFTGYQAEATRGRRILEGEQEIRIFGENIPVKCKIARLQGISAHADQTGLLQWVRQIDNAPKFTFLVHGEPESMEGLTQKLAEEKGWKAIIPEYMESFSLFEGL